MKVFKTKGFARFARREGIRDAQLCEAVERAERGIVDADLGAGVIKQRVARPGQGRSGGYRVLIFYRSRTRTVFVDGFAKSHLDNISDDDLVRLRELAAEFLGYNVVQVVKLVETGAWIEIECDD